jgi:hypothetical protein
MGFDRADLMDSGIAYRIKSTIPKWNVCFNTVLYNLLVSLLLGICLSSVRKPYSGNLLVWPGTHRILHRYRACVLMIIMKISDHSLMLPLPPRPSFSLLSQLYHMDDKIGARLGITAL